MSERAGLGYPFAAVPRWIRLDVEGGVLSHRDFALIVYLYESAETGLLKHREETPRLMLATIAKKIRWAEEEASLARHLRRLRDANRWFTFRTEGNSRTRVFYVFRLYPDGPLVSDQRPPVPAASRPPVAQRQPVASSGKSVSVRGSVSVRADGADAGSCPPVPSTCPPVQEATSPHRVTETANAEPVACPPALDVLENTNPSMRENVEGPASLSRARENTTDAVDDDAMFRISDELAQARTARGAYWEPK